MKISNTVKISYDILKIIEGDEYDLVTYTYKKVYLLQE
jgi:hypothetical protein